MAVFLVVGGTAGLPGTSAYRTNLRMCFLVVDIGPLRALLSFRWDGHDQLPSCHWRTLSVIDFTRKLTLIEP